MNRTKCIFAFDVLYGEHEDNTGQASNDSADEALSDYDAGDELHSLSQENQIFFRKIQCKYKDFVIRPISSNKNDLFQQMIFFLVRNDYISDLQELISLNPEINIQFLCNDISPLMLSCAKGYADMTDLLLSMSETSNIALCNSKGYSVLHFGAWHGSKESLKIVLNFARDTIGLNFLQNIINVQDCAGNSPLYWASIQGKEDIAHMLIAHGANMDIDMLNHYDENTLSGDVADQPDVS